MRILSTLSIFVYLCISSFHGVYAQTTQPFRGISGMALIDAESIESEYLYIYDFKVRPGEENLKRFGTLATTDGKEYSAWNPVPVDSEDWSQIGGVKGNDFEAICKATMEIASCLSVTAYLSSNS